MSGKSTQYAIGLCRAFLSCLATSRNLWLTLPPSSTSSARASTPSRSGRTATAASSTRRRRRRRRSTRRAGPCATPTTTTCTSSRRAASASSFAQREHAHMISAKKGRKAGRLCCNGRGQGCKKIQIFCGYHMSIPPKRCVMQPHHRNGVSGGGGGRPVAIRPAICDKARKKQQGKVKGRGEGFSQPMEQSSSWSRWYWVP